MQQLTNKEIARVFMLYAPTTVHIGKRTYTQEKDQFFFAAYGIGFFNPNREYCFSDYTIRFEAIPLDKITDEHAIEVAKIHKHHIVKKHYSDTDLRAYLIMQGVRIATEMYEEDYRVYLYLIQQGYAVPLFFGINHWANGKTAIELGIAIDKIL